MDVTRRVVTGPRGLFLPSLDHRRWWVARAHAAAAAHRQAPRPLPGAAPCGLASRRSPFDARQERRKLPPGGREHRSRRIAFAKTDRAVGRGGDIEALALGVAAERRLLPVKFGHGGLPTACRADV